MLKSPKSVSTILVLFKERLAVQFRHWAFKYACGILMEKRKLSYLLKQKHFNF